MVQEGELKRIIVPPPTHKPTNKTPSLSSVCTLGLVKVACRTSLAEITKLASQ